ncbi:MAG: hypothetical protein JW828_00145 [Sedimentisphaerales bacterium]|nr:hypothetical protein [Sedimentisphaerales bacterium]
MIIIRIVILVALIRLLTATEQPFLCAGLYAGVRCLFAVAINGPSWSILVFGAVAFLLASLYFWLLDRFDETFWWWIIMVVGFGIGLV